MGKFVTKTGKDGQFYFNLQADNGQIILSSEGYTTKAACQNGIESVKKNAGESDNYDQLSSVNGKFYFNLKAGNGQVIGKSQMYESEDGMINGMASCIKNAHNADVVEEA
jgi:uncharacterized protein